MAKKVGRIVKGFDRVIMICYNISMDKKENSITEEWRDIPGYEGYYQVSNLGRVKGLSRWINGNKRKCTDEHILKEGDNRGYKRVVLSVNAVHKSFSVHRLVAEAFLPNPNNYSQINHIDGNKTNNLVNNLEWCNASQNNLHKFRVLGYQVSQKTRDKISSASIGRKWSEESRNNLSKILRGKKKPSLCRKVLCRTTGEVFSSIQEAARAKGVHGSNITMCCQGKIKQIKGWEWEFLNE